jgi:hypothetical protein
MICPWCEGHGVRINAIEGLMMIRGTKVVALCGSTRFRQEYARAFSLEEHAGRICLSVPCYKDDSCCKSPEAHEILDTLHLRKIDLADEILVLDIGGYIGASTQSEIRYARNSGKVIRFWSQEHNDLP